MSWCEHEGVDYILRLAKNARLKELIGEETVESTAAAVLFTARSMSSVVVKRPRLNLTDSYAASRGIPMARRTSDGSIEPELHALPVDTATGSMLVATASASAPSNRMFAVFGSRRVTSPMS